MCILQTRKQFWAIALFFTEGHIFATVIAAMLILGRHMYFGQISLQSKFGTVYQDVYFTDQNTISAFFYRGPYFCNRNIYNVDTWQAHVIVADKSSAKISYCILPGCVFYRLERNFFGHPSVIGLWLAQFCPKFWDVLTICIGR